MRYSFLLDDKYKITANVRDKITKMHHFVAWYKHSNITSNTTFEGSFKCRAFIYALVNMHIVLAI